MRSMRVVSVFAIFAAFAQLPTTLSLGNGRHTDSFQTQDKPPGITQLAWLAGDWGSNEGQRQVEEHWTMPSGQTMIGMGRTVTGERTVSFEYLRIEARADGMYYVAQPQGRPPVDFRLVRIGPTEVVFENPGHSDHLQHIIYRRESEDTIVARIEGSNNGKSFAQDFRYKRASIR